MRVVLRACCGPAPARVQHLSEYSLLRIGLVCRTPKTRAPLAHLLNGLLGLKFDSTPGKTAGIAYDAATGFKFALRPCTDAEALESFANVGADGVARPCALHSRTQACQCVPLQKDCWSTQRK